MKPVEKDECCVYIKEKYTLKRFSIMVDDNVVGFADVISPGGTLCNLEILPQYREKGIGTIAVGLFIEHCEVTNLKVDVDNDIAMHVYEKNGFDVDNTKTCIGMRLQTMHSKGYKTVALTKDREKERAEKGYCYNGKGERREENAVD